MTFLQYFENEIIYEYEKAMGCIYSKNDKDGNHDIKGEISICKLDDLEAHLNDQIHASFHPVFYSSLLN